MDLWFRRLAEVPGLQYSGDSSVDRYCLLGHDYMPKVRSQEFNGQLTHYLYWHGEDNNQSPSISWETNPKPNETLTQTCLRQLKEKLELPGSLRDYSSIIQNCYEELWKSRRGSPEVLTVVEELCLLHINLVELYPDTIAISYNNETNYVIIGAFDILLKLYEREGYLDEAMKIADRHVRFNAYRGNFLKEKIRVRIDSLEAECESSNL